MRSEEKFRCAPHARVSSRLCVQNLAVLRALVALSVVGRPLVALEYGLGATAGSLTSLACGRTLARSNQGIASLTSSDRAANMRRVTKFILGGVAVVTVGAAATAGYVIWTKAINPRLVTRTANTEPFSGDRTRLLEVGTTRHGDTSLSPIGRSCNTCHSDENSYNETFNRAFPHYVQSVRFKTGLDQITAEGMVQFCMISAMEGRPLEWNSETLAALTAFVLERNRKAIAGQSSKSSMLNETCADPPFEMTPVPAPRLGMQTTVR
jgi:hypothetical protein